MSPGWTDEYTKSSISSEILRIKHLNWWIRDFRFGEWLPEPLTSLFADWLLPVIEAGMTMAQRAEQWRTSLLPHYLLAVAWKMESVLARFYHRYLEAKEGPGYQLLLCGLPGMEPKTLPFAVQSADWFHPTLGEIVRRRQFAERGSRSIACAPARHCRDNLQICLGGQSQAAASDSAVAKGEVGKTEATATAT